MPDLAAKNRRLAGRRIRRIFKCSIHRLWSKVQIPRRSKKPKLVINDFGGGGGRIRSVITSYA